MTIKPILKAILLCDLTLVEAGTNKRSLIGLFDSINAAQFPATHASMSVYVQFREIEGTFDFSLELCDLSDGKILNKAVISRYQVPNRSQDCELVFNLMAVKFEKPGEFEFRIYADDSVFGQKSFKVVSSKK